MGITDNHGESTAKKKKMTRSIKVNMGFIQLVRKNNFAESKLEKKCNLNLSGEILTIKG